MFERDFRMVDILAAMHAFPFLMAAYDGDDLDASIDKLNKISLLIIDMGGDTNSLTWTAISKTLKMVLTTYFLQSGLASEPIPSHHYWCVYKKKIRPEKIQELKTWIGDMESKYGKTLHLPDFIGAQILQIVTHKSAAYYPLNTPS